MAAVPNDIATAKPSAPLAPLSRKSQRQKEKEKKQKNRHRLNINKFNRPPSPSPPPTPTPPAPSTSTPPLPSTSTSSKKHKVDKGKAKARPSEWTDEQRARAAEKDLGGDGDDNLRKQAWEEVMEGIAEPLNIGSMLLERLSPGLARRLYELVEKLGDQRRFPQYSAKNKGAMEGTCLHFNMAPGDEDWHTDEKSLYTGYVST